MSGWCGCCGRNVHQRKGDFDPIWCSRCMGHVAATGHLWDRTFEAINGEPCPFQEKSDAS